MEKRCGLKTFALVKGTSAEGQEGKSAASFSVPMMLDDYCKKKTTQISVYSDRNQSPFFIKMSMYIYIYACHPPTSDTNLLDCSCDGVIALALGSSVYLWNSVTRSVVGHLDQTAASGQPSSGCQTQSISCVCWSGDGRILCIGTRRREIQVFRCSAGGKLRHIYVTNLNNQLNHQDVQVQWLCLWLCSCGMLNMRRRSGVYRHTCLWSEPFPGRKTCWAGGGCQCVCVNRDTILSTVLKKPDSNFHAVACASVKRSAAYIHPCRHDTKYI